MPQRFIEKLPDGFDLSRVISVEYDDIYTRAEDGEYECFIRGFGPAKRISRKVKGFYIEDE